jgi:hypothetical protein
MTPRELSDHLRQLGGRTPADARSLTDLLVRRCWPALDTDGGAARRWLVQGPPRTAGVLPPVCACARARERCAVCN